jgi:3-hydroxyanthranilate 3,4-dioxygenase
MAKKLSATSRFPLENLQGWIRKNSKDFLPPVSNKQLFNEAKDVILFVSGGPNTRNDYHVNPTEELFYQLKGTIAVRLRPLDGSEPYDQIIKEGEIFLLPRWVPHRPQRPAGTLGLIVEFPRPEGQLDGLRWYCPQCDALVHEALWQLKKIDEDLKIIMEDFWGGPAERRTCKQCQHVIERAGAIKVSAGKVTAAKRSKKTTKVAKAASTRQPGAASVKKNRAAASKKVAGRR